MAKKKRKKILVKDRKAMLQLFAEGKSFEAIAKELERAASTIENHMAQMGYSRRSPRPDMAAMRRLGNLSKVASLKGATIGTAFPVGGQNGSHAETVADLPRQAAEQMRMPVKPVTPKDRQDMLRLFINGVNFKDISRSLRRSGTTVTNHMAQMGLYWNSDRPWQMSEEEQAALAKLEPGTEIGIVAKGKRTVSGPSKAHPDLLVEGDLVEETHNAVLGLLGERRARRELGLTPSLWPHLSLEESVEVEKTTEDGWSEMTRVLRYAEWAHDRIAVLEAELEAHNGFMDETVRKTNWLKDRARRVLHLVKGDQGEKQDE